MHFKISSNSFYGQINKLTLLQMLNKKTSNIGWNVCKNALLLNENIASWSNNDAIYYDEHVINIASHILF